MATGLPSHKRIKNCMKPVFTVDEKWCLYVNIMRSPPWFGKDEQHEPQPKAGICSSDSLTDLHKAMKEKRKEVAQDVIAKVINESIPYATDAPQPALAEYETFHQNKKVNYIKDKEGKLIFREFRRLSIAHAMNRIKGVDMDTLSGRNSPFKDM
ncbi:hypothetical protein Y032_0205g1951 [Ancylostoma ceylanicum]|nr:hypothetical protein Y032_0205g1951 [Ancylostoma ceylanicum]